MGEVALPPKEYPHTEVGLEQMALVILELGEDTGGLMEATGRYHEPVAEALHEYGIRVTVINPLFIKQSGGGSIHKVKADKAGAMKIAECALDNRVDLREYIPMETTWEELKLCSRQYNIYMKNVVALQNNLISLTGKTFPWVNELFSSPDRADGSQKWIDFVTTFWHCECICLVSEAAFTELASAKAMLAVLRAEMDRLARQLSEYETVRAMYGVGERTAPQLMAEIGDVRRFPRRSSVVSFADVDPAVDESGKHISKSNPTTKRGSPHLRKTLYQIVCTYLRKAPADEPVYQFLDKNGPMASPISSI